MGARKNILETYLLPLPPYYPKTPIFKGGYLTLTRELETLYKRFKAELRIF